MGRAFCILRHAPRSRAVVHREVGLRARSCGPIILDHLRERYTFAPTGKVAMKPEVTLRPVGGMPLMVRRRVTQFAK